MTTPIDPRLILDRLDAGTLVRHEWGDGHETACLLAALAPVTAERKSASVCPASTMPMWLAELTPEIDDCVSDGEWRYIVRRYAEVAGQWHTLDDAAWGRCHIGVLIAVVEEAMRHTRSRAALSACAEVIAAIQSGDAIRVSEARAMAWSASLVEWVSSPVAGWAASSASSAAEAAEAWSSAVSSASSARAAAVLAAVASARVAARVDRTEGGMTMPEARMRAEAAAWDRMSAAILDVIERECEVARG